MRCKLVSYCNIFQRKLRYSFSVQVAFFGSLLAIVSVPVVAGDYHPPIGAHMVTGVERGSTAVVGKVKERTGFVIFDTYGSEDFGPGTAGGAAALPHILHERDQFDAVAVLAGPLETGRKELIAGGLGYRMQVSPFGPTLFANADYGDAVAGRAPSRALGAKADRLALTVGVRQTLPLSKTEFLTGEVSFVARSASAELLGTEVVNEDLRILRAKAGYRRLWPEGHLVRAELVLSKGLDALGASAPDNPRASTRGASTENFDAAFRADASMPVFGPVGVAVGAVGQWSDDSLPFAQTCSFASNEYSRAFDRSYVSGDSCIGGRAEAFVNLPTEWAQGRLKAWQVFSAADAGQTWTERNKARPGGRDTWASAYAGMRVLAKDFIGEASFSKILDEPAGTVPQDETRFWVRMGLRF